MAQKKNPFDLAREKLAGFGKSVSQYLDPTSNGGNNFWSTSAARGLGRVQGAVESLPQQARKDWIQGGIIRDNPLVPTAIKQPLATVVQLGPAPFIQGWSNTLSAFSPKQGLAEKIGNIASGVGQTINPLQAMEGGLVNIGFQGAVNKLQGKRFLDNSVSSYQGGFDFSSKLGAINRVASPVTSRLVERVLPGVGALSSVTKAGLKGGVPMGILGFSEPAENTKDRLKNSASQFAAGFALEGLNKTGSVAFNKFVERVAGNYRKLNPSSTNEEALKVAKKFVRAPYGRFAEKGKAQSKDTVFYGDLRESLGLPRNASDVWKNNRKGSINFDELGKLVKPNKRGVQSLGQILDDGYKPGSGKKSAIENPQNPFFNVNRVGVDDKSKQALSDLVQTQSVKQEIGNVVGKPLTLKEVQTRAQVSKELGRTFTRGDALQLGSEALAIRNRLADLAKSGLDDGQAVEVLVRDKAFGAYLARLLGQRRIVSDPTQKTIFNEIIGKVLKSGVDPEDVIKAAKGVDFNNREAAADFYRKFIKATPSDWVDVVRYSSMLSSPTTGLVNTTSNLQGTGLVTPIEKTLSGTINFLTSKATGKKQTQFAREGSEYAKGYWSSLGKAAHNFADVMRGTKISTMQELTDIPLTKQGTAGRAVENVLKLPSRLLQAQDEFFKTLTKSGLSRSTGYRELKTGIKTKPSDIDKEALKRLFNADFNLPEEGPILKSLEYIPQAVMRARHSNNKLVSNIAKFTFPFVRIPSNILKQSVEYSPLGLATLPGSSNKTEQFTKALMGSTIALGTAMLAENDMITFGEPSDQKKKAMFRAAGMQPYSVKIGDNWVSYSKLHPVMAFNLALGAAWKDANENKKLNDDQLDTVLKVGSNWWGFFADQSYVKNIGDFVASAKGDLEGVNRYISNYPQQLIPYRALMGWINRAFDPYQRKIDPTGTALEQQLQQIAMNIPGLSGSVPPRIDTEGEPIENQNRLLNAFSPLRVTTQNDKKVKEFDYLGGRSPESTLSKLRALPKDEANQIAKIIKERNPGLYGNIIKLMDDQKLGVTEKEVKIRNMPIYERANKIATEIKALSTREEKNSLFKDWTDKRLITPEVKKILMEMIKRGEL